jgi:O-antigen/teichoic acid export membrane protein
MNFTSKILKTTTSSWFGVATTVIVGVVLPPIILHKLGDESFGLWILIFSFTGYYGIFDLGIRSSIVKHVAEFDATGDRDRLTRLVNVSLFVYGCVALALLMIVGIGSLYFDAIFHIPTTLHDTALILFLMVGAGVAVGFPLSIFAGILEGLQEFHLLNLTQAVATLLRALLIVLALDHGKGILSIAFVTVAFPLLTYLLYAWKVMRTVPLQFGIRFLDRATFRQSFHYSFFSFISMVAFRLRFQTDAIIIGAMISTSAVTYFSIGSKLIDYPFLLVGGLTQIIPAMSSQIAAMGDSEHIRKLFVVGNRACAFVVFPMSAVLIVLGRSVIDVWVGPRYESSYVILIILLVPTMLADMQATSRQMLYGMGRHKALALVNVVEGIVNVIMSIVLIRYWGIIGDALGTAVPLALTSLFFLPSYCCRLVKVPLKKFLSEAYLLPSALCAPLVITLLFSRSVFHPHNFAQLIMQLAPGGLVYGISVLWWFLVREPIGIESRIKAKQYVSQLFSR